MRKKWIDRIGLVLLAFVLCISNVGCGQRKSTEKELKIEDSSGQKEESQDDIVKVELSQKTLNISGKSAEETI